MNAPDFTLSCHGNLWLLTPQNCAAREWSDEHLVTENWQLWCGGIAIDQHFVDDIIVGAQNAGFTVGPVRSH